jgi:hypothetical protein
MSTNDDPASRRGRRAAQGEPEWSAHNRRPGDRWDQPSSGNREGAGNYSGRDNQAPGAAYSGFTRPAYSQQSPEPSQQARPFDPQPQQNYYPENSPRQEPPRSYNEPVLPAYSPPLPAYRQEPQLPSFGDAGRDDLFGRDSGGQGYDQAPFGSQSGYQPSAYDPAASRAPLAPPAAPQDYYRQPQQPADDYDRGFAGRGPVPDSSSSRFFLQDEQPQASQQWQQPYSPPAPQPPLDRGYPAGQGYQPAGFDPAPQAFGGGQLDPRYAGQEAWHAEDHGYHEGGAGLPALHADEFDDDFFGDDEEFDDHQDGKKRGRKMLVFAAVAAAAVAGGGFYAYKTMLGGDKATPFIRADNRPSKESPGNPGGRQFPNGEKAIYERLTPDGQTQVASFAPQPSPRLPDQAAQGGAPAAGGNSLDDRIEEALRRAQRSGDAPTAAPAPRPGSDQPTIVRSEIYRPDGTRVDSRPVIQPQFANVNQGQLPPPFGTAAPMAVPASPPPSAAFRSAPAPTPAPQQFATAMASPTPRAAPAAGGFYVSLKSAPDEKAIQRDLPALSDKYKSVLGDVQIISKIADLGSKGVTYRAVAGPLGSRQEAMDLCQKIKGVGGDKACFVTN